MGERELATANSAYREAYLVLERLARAGETAPGAPLAPSSLPDEKTTATAPSARHGRPADTAPSWSENTLRRLLESLPDALVVISRQGTIMLVNDQTEQLFGYPRGELLGQPVEMLIPERLRVGHVDHRDGYFAAPRSRAMGARQELFGRRKNGTEFPVEISLSPLLTDQGTMATAAIRDVSERKRNEAKFRTLVENIPAVTFIAPLDASAPELYVSPQIEQLLGFSAKEWLEDPVLWYRQLHPDDRERWNRQFAPICANGEPFRAVYRFVAKDGHVVWVHGSASVVRDTNGAPSFLEGVAFDITSIKEAEAERDRFFALSLDLFCVAGLDGYFKRVNESFTRTLGFSTRELLAAPFLDFVHPDDRAAAEAEVSKLAGGGVTIDFEVRIRCRDGSYKWLEWAAIPQVERQVMFAVGRDVTDRRRDEQQLREFNEMLEQRVSERTAALARESEERRLLNAALLRSNQDLDEFAYIASHDLKEPLRGIGNYATFLLEDYAGRLDDDGRTKLETLVRLSGRMTDLLDGLLQFSRLGRGELAVGLVDLNDVLSQVLDSLQMLVEEQDVVVRVPAPLPVVRADRVRVGEVFRNLITNAVKYNDKEQKWVEIGFQGPTKQGDVIVFHVRDNGIGIHPRHQDGVFRMFKRLHARDRFGGGTGVGLTIAKKIVERHGGRIWIASEVGAGTTFFFTLAGEAIT